ncbi:MAG TPA: hypothetical protein VE954_02100 [Oligoflexus sp.]|uniref:hypothetical protein n=1 Tax=Oligoflexus sp. TaxID=1971216 RepID=UPI002D3A0D41|nr:hypothetical protein [Oligoflexus sp.]HYX31878.1 hypothetical protein [Oligoflexus sp.]
MDSTRLSALLGNDIDAPTLQNKFDETPGAPLCSGFIRRPRSSAQWLRNARIIHEAVCNGHKPQAIARELLITKQDISRYRKVCGRWPKKALELIERNPQRITAGTITRLANTIFSDVKGRGDPRGRHKKPTLLATLEALLSGRKQPGGIGTAAMVRDPYRRRLIEETARNQRLSQELRDLKSSEANDHTRRERRRLIIENERLKAALARHGITAAEKRRMSAVVTDPNLNYLLSLLLAKSQVATDVDEELGILVMNAGSKAALGRVVERMVC